MLEIDRSGNYSNVLQGVLPTMFGPSVSDTLMKEFFDNTFKVLSFDSGYNRSRVHMAAKLIVNGMKFGYVQNSEELRRDDFPRVECELVLHSLDQYYHEDDPDKTRLDLTVSYKWNNVYFHWASPKYMGDKLVLVKGATVIDGVGKSLFEKDGGMIRMNEKLMNKCVVDPEKGVLNLKLDTSLNFLPGKKDFSLPLVVEPVYPSEK
jgi:hypothetical protein